MFGVIITVQYCSSTCHKFAKLLHECTVYLDAGHFSDSINDVDDKHCISDVMKQSLRIHISITLF